MLKKRIIGLLLASVLLGGATLGCATTEYVYVSPECTVPPMPSNLPEPDVDYIYDRLGTEVAEQLLERERLIIDSLLEHRAILGELCK